MGIRIHHWRFEDGNVRSDYYGRGAHVIFNDPPPRGWYCWVYNGDKEFEDWMEKNCPTADVTFRFNSGNPMHTVFITADKEATIFQLKWSDCL